MPTFTTRLYELLDDETFDVGMATADYPIFDEAYRPLLNAKILDHYAMYEIGQDTEGMFRFALNRRMREIMPYYNQLYLSEKIVFDPLSTMSYTDVGDSDNTLNTQSDQASNNTNTTTSKARVVNSELPQVHLSPDEDYASSGADTVSDTTAGGDGTASNTGLDTATGNTTHTLEGRQGAAALLLMQYRQSLLNIDMMVVADCLNLFMGVWNTSDNYSRDEGFRYVVID